MISWRQAMILGSLGAIVLCGAASILFQDNLARFLINPRTPYQLYSPPPPPAYGARGAWALWPDDPNAHDVDIFYVHSTTYDSRRQWNGPLRDDEADATLRHVAAPNEAGPFFRVGGVYAPRYRQATLFAEFTHKFEGLAARELAFEDIEKAFAVFISERPRDRPFILVGYGQGGLHVLGLLQLHIAKDESLRRYLAAAYIIEQSAPLSVFEGSLSTVPPCHTKEDVRCVISYVDVQQGFDDEKRRFLQRALVWEKDKNLRSIAYPEILCINPLAWTDTKVRIEPDRHKGAASATGLGMRDPPPLISSSIGAQCVEGVLIVDTPRQSFLRRHHWFGDHWRPQDFNLFYNDLSEDARRRVNQLKAKLESEDSNANNINGKPSKTEPPLKETVDLDAEPEDKDGE